ncbi:cytochrome P450 [Streptomyces sp. NPDC001796]|uniref:cytochrome P450 n=1 Tax=Streptomyces sp. NPDC001796 TaxID=3364609 RepID=UPI0036CCF4C5
MTTDTDDRRRAAAGGTSGGSLPPVRPWPALHPPGPGFDPDLAELMREGPVIRVGRPDGEGWAWLVTRYDDVRAVTNDPRFGHEPVRDGRPARLAPHVVPQRDAVAFPNPSDPARPRRSVAAAFTARGVERVRETARRMLDELVDELLQDGPPADLTAAVLGPFPGAVICELMGVPAADRHDMRTWTRLILSPAHGTKAGERARDEMSAYFTGLIGAHESATGEDVVSLLGAAVGLGEVALDEAAGLAVLLQIGAEAVTGHTGRIFHLLLTRPDLTQRLRAEPAIRPQAIDELLRYVPHRNAVGPPRVATQDVEVGGVRIRRGEAVYVSYAAANRDPGVFPDPETIDFARYPNPHVAFGSGPHRCPGGMPTRMASEMLLDALLDRVPGLRLAVPPDEVPFREGALTRGPEALPVTW